MGPFDLKKFIAENRTTIPSVEEMASTGKLERNEDYQFLLAQLKQLIKDEAILGQTLKIVGAIGELGLDIGYAEGLSDSEMTK